MAQYISPIESAADRMVEAALPLHATPSRDQRIASFQTAQQELARLSVDTIFSISKENKPDYKSIIPLGVYATREALESLTTRDCVDFSLAGRTADELQLISTYLKNKIKLSPYKTKQGDYLGFGAELGVANMLWAGIADGELDLNYAVLMGTYGHEKDHSGLRGDVDLIVKTNRSGKQSRKKLQIKASSKKSHHVYEEGITVITAQDLVGSESAIEAVDTLLKWKRVDPDLKTEVYRNVEDAIGIKSYRKLAS